MSTVSLLLALFALGFGYWEMPFQHYYGPKGGIIGLAIVLVRCIHWNIVQPAEIARYAKRDPINAFIHAHIGRLFFYPLALIAVTAFFYRIAGAEYFTHYPPQANYEQHSEWQQPLLIAVTVVGVVTAAIAVAWYAIIVALACWKDRPLGSDQGKAADPPSPA